MRIGLVLSQVPGYSETFFRNKIKLLLDAGHEVIVFAENPDRLEIEGARIMVPFSISKTLSIRVFTNVVVAFFYCLLIIPIRSIKFLLNELKDNIHIKEAFGNLLINARILSSKLDWLHFGFATMALQRENVGKTIAARVAVSFRGYDIAIYPVKHPGCYSRLWTKLDKVHTISDDLLQIAYKIGLPSDIPVLKVTPAINVELFYLPNRTGQISGKVRILSVGRLHWKKGYEYAFRALVLLRQRHIDFEFTIVGDGSEYERLSYSVLQQGLTDCVVFAGKKQHSEIAKLMQDYDLYLQPSVQEGFCNSVLEAQCSGLFCIVSDAEGLSENVLDGKTGWVVPKRSPEAIAAAIENVISMKLDERLAMIKTAQKRVSEEFSLKIQMEKFNEFYTL